MEEGFSMQHSGKDTHYRLQSSIKNILTYLYPKGKLTHYSIQYTISYICGDYAQ